MSLAPSKVLAGDHEHFLQLGAHAHLKVKIQSVKMTVYTQIQLL